MADSDSDVKPLDVCSEHIPSFRRETDIYVVKSCLGGWDMGYV